MQKTQCPPDQGWYDDAMKLLMFVGVNVGGAVGWALGENVGIMTAFFLSAVFSVLGIVGGWWIAKRYLV